MKLFQLLAVLDDDTIITIRKGARQIYNGSKYFLLETTEIEETTRKAILNTNVSNLWYSPMYNSLMIVCSDYEWVVFTK